MTKLNASLRLCGFIAILFASSRTDAAPPFVRIWEGIKRADISNEGLYSFLSEVLIRTTVTANPNSVQAYLPMILDLNQPLPADAFLKELPFHEAALVIHQSEEAYNAAQQVTSGWYREAHFLGFDKSLSFSASPKIFSGTLEMASSTNKVGFDLRDPSRQWDADWQTGYVLVSVILRKQNFTDADYLSAVARYAERVKAELGEALDGHFIRVGPGHILEFLRFGGQADYERYRRTLDEISARFSEGFIFDYYRKLADPVAHGLVSAAPGRAFSVRFQRPFRGCQGTLVAMATRGKVSQ